MDYLIIIPILAVLILPICIFFVAMLEIGNSNTKPKLNKIEKSRTKLINSL